MIFQINFQVKEKKSKVKGYSVSATDLIEVIGLSKISSINGSFPSVYLAYIRGSRTKHISGAGSCWNYAFSLNRTTSIENGRQNHAD